jgi:hypothetical protein
MSALDCNGDRVPFLRVLPDDLAIAANHFAAAGNDVRALKSHHQTAIASLRNAFDNHPEKAGDVLSQMQRLGGHLSDLGILLNHVAIALEAAAADYRDADNAIGDGWIPVVVDQGTGPRR